MKKIGLIITLVWILLVGGAEAERVEAKDYSIDKVKIEMEVERSGKVNVVESRTYNFDGDYTFAYVEIDKKGERSQSYILDSFSVCDETSCYRQLADSEISTADTNRPAGTFYVQNRGSSYYIKWFYRASNIDKVFNLGYEIENGLTKQGNVVEFYWKLVGDRWEISQSNIEANIKLPEGIDGEKIKAWAHGPLTGKVSIPNETEVKYEMDRINSGEFFEARVMVPADGFDVSVVGNKTKEKIEEEELGFIKETERKSTVNKISRSGLEVLILALSGGSIWVFVKQVKNFWKYGKDEKLPEVSLPVPSL